MRFDFEHSDFEKYKLGELVENVVAGATPKTSVEEYWDGGNIPWLSSGEVHKKYVYFTDKFITSEGYNNSSTKLVPKNSVLIALAGQGKTRGTVAINKIELCTNQSIASIIPNDNLYYKFLFYYLESKYDYLRALSSSDGGRGGLNLKLIRSIPIQIPSVDEQKVISNFINSIDKKITILERKYESYQDFKKYLMQQIFAQKLRFDFKDEWKQYKLKDLLSVKSSSISINQLEDNTGTYPLYGASGFLKNIDFCEMETDYISIVKDGSGVGNLSYHEKNSSIVNTSQYLLPKKNFDIHFLYYLLQTLNLLKYVNGSSIPHIYFKDYCIEKVNVPSLPEQQQIGKLLVDADKTLENINNCINITQEFKKGLLQQMFVVQLILSLLQNKKHI